MCLRHLVICRGEGESTMCGGWGMSSSKFVVWGILIITTTTGTLFYNGQYVSGTCECESIQAKGMYWGMQPYKSWRCFKCLLKTEKNVREKEECWREGGSEVCCVVLLLHLQGDHQSRVIALVSISVFSQMKQRSAPPEDTRPLGAMRGGSLFVCVQSFTCPQSSANVP